jgi:hypothetical protein
MLHEILAGGVVWWGRLDDVTLEKCLEQKPSQQRYWERPSPLAKYFVSIVVVPIVIQGEMVMADVM